MATVKSIGKDLLSRLLFSLPLVLLAHCAATKQERSTPVPPPAVSEAPAPPALSPEELLERFNLALDRA